MHPELTVAIANFNGCGVLEETLEAIASLRTPIETLLVDDGSTDDSVTWVREHHPGVRIVEMGYNTRRVSVVRNRALAEARTRHVLLIDNDITVSDAAIATMMEVMHSRERVLCCTPRLLHRNDTTRVYHDGGRLHFLGLSADLIGNIAVEKCPPGPPRPTISCGIMLIDRERAIDVGGFDEGYAFGWGDDGEFQVRGVLRGYQVLHVPEAVMLHVERPHGNTRAYAQLYNRYRLMLTCYSWRTLLALLPPLLAFEVAIAAAGLAKGFSGDHLRALRAIVRERRDLLARRREIQARRVVGDGFVLAAGRLQVGSRAAPDSSASAVSRLLAAYWRVASLCIEGDDERDR